MSPRPRPSRTDSPSPPEPMEAPAAAEPARRCAGSAPSRRRAARAVARATAHGWRSDDRSSFVSFLRASAPHRGHRASAAPVRPTPATRRSTGTAGTSLLSQRLGDRFARLACSAQKFAHASSGKPLLKHRQVRIPPAAEILEAGRALDSAVGQHEPRAVAFGRQFVSDQRRSCRPGRWSRAAAADRTGPPSR